MNTYYAGKQGFNQGSGTAERFRDWAKKGAPPPSPEMLKEPPPSRKKIKISIAKQRKIEKMGV